MNECVRLRLCAVYTCHCSGCDAVREQTSPVLSLWRGLFVTGGAALVTAGETHRLPTPRGSNQRAAEPATLFRPPGHPCRKESQTFGLLPFRILWIATAVGCQSTHARLRCSRTTGPREHKSPWSPRPQSATGPRVYKSSWNPRPLRATGPRVYKSSLTWSHRGQPALESATSLSARDHNGQPAPVSAKAVLKLDHQGTTSPTGVQISPFS